MPISQPSVTVNISGAQQFISTAPHKVLFIGQKLAAGTATSGALVSNIGNDNSEDTLFGQRSMIAGMIRSFKKINKNTRVDAISLSDNGAGTAATAVIAITGPATAAGTLTFNIGSRQNHSYSIAVASADTATVIGDALVAAITADADAPFTAVNAIGTVTITASQKGTVANAYGVEVQGTVAGVSFVITGWAGGATDPSLTGLFDPVATDRYQTVVWPSNYTIADVVTFLDARFNVTNSILDGVAITSKTDTYANHITALGLLNSKSLSYHCNQTVNTANKYVGSSLFEINENIAAQFAAIRSLRLTDGTSLSGFVVGTGGPADNTGGPALASLPYFNTPFAFLPLIDVEHTWTSLEIEGLLTAGGFAISNNLTRTSIICGEVPTTYKTDAVGNPDDSFKFLNYVDTSVTSREIFFNNFKSNFAQHRLTTGDLVPGRKIANQESVESFLDGVYQTLSGPDYVLVEAGEDAFLFFKENRTVTINTLAGSVTIFMKTPIQTQTRTILADMQIAFSTN